MSANVTVSPDDLRHSIEDVLYAHTYVIDGPPAVIGVRCPCGFRNHGEYLTPERADRIARRHIAAEVVVDLSRDAHKAVS